MPLKLSIYSIITAFFYTGIYLGMLLYFRLLGNLDSFNLVAILPLFIGFVYAAIYSFFVSKVFIKDNKKDKRLFQIFTIAGCFVFLFYVVLSRI